MREVFWSLAIVLPLALMPACGNGDDNAAGTPVDSGGAGDATKADGGTAAEAGGVDASSNASDASDASDGGHTDAGDGGMAIADAATEGG